MKSPRRGSQPHTHCAVDVITATVTAKGGRCWALKGEYVKVRGENHSRRSRLGLQSPYKGSASQMILWRITRITNQLWFCVQAVDPLCAHSGHTAAWADAWVSSGSEACRLSGVESPNWLGALLYWTPSMADLSLHFPNSSCATFGHFGDTKELLWGWQ